MLINFYQNKLLIQIGLFEPKLVSIKDIWEWNFDKLEYNHDYIQYLFPLTEISMFNPEAPTLIEEDIQYFKDNLRENLIISAKVFCNFLGITIDGQKADNFLERRFLFEKTNHNWLRITRMLKSLSILGCEDISKKIFSLLEYLHKQEGLVSGNSFKYWEEAIQ